MKYRVFDKFQQGFSHVKKNMGCEDYSMSYADPNGRYYICTVCDGHSDEKCFRSAKGAQYGCEAAVEILSRFFELYYEDENRTFSFNRNAEMRLKTSIKQSWIDKVTLDLEEHPLQAEELAPLSDRARKYYEAGEGLQHIYGATFLAMAVCTDGYIALHIGDGVMLCVDEEGVYYEPLAEDEKGQTGSPASLCDSDLFTRPNAFRCVCSSKLPQIMVVSTDGVGDCVDELYFKELICGMLLRFEEYENNPVKEVLNEQQKAYLKYCLEYYADQGNGAEDDCSLAGIYAYDKRITPVKIAPEVAQQLWKEAVAARNEVVLSYDSRKKQFQNDIKVLLRSIRDDESIIRDDKKYSSFKKHLTQLVQALKSVVSNEENKLSYWDNRLSLCRQYLSCAEVNDVDSMQLLSSTPIEQKFWEAVEKFMNDLEVSSKEPKKVTENAAEDIEDVTEDALEKDLTRNQRDWQVEMWDFDQKNAEQQEPRGKRINYGSYTRIQKGNQTFFNVVMKKGGLVLKKIGDSLK